MRLAIPSVLALCAIAGCQGSTTGTAAQAPTPVAAPAPSVETPAPAGTPAPAEAAPAAQPAPPPEPAPDPEKAALEAAVTPFLPEDTEGTYIEKGAFGPADDTIIVVTFTFMGPGEFAGFALVADDKAERGYRKLPLPKLPAASLSGQMAFVATGNLDKDPALELVLQFDVFRTTGNAKEGGYGYSTFELVALDWDARKKKFVRLAAVEKKLAKTFSDPADPPGPEDIRKALGLDNP